MITLSSPPAAFLKFNTEPEEHCIYGTLDLPLPVIYATDYAWQWVLSGSTEAETLGIFGATVRVGLVLDESDADFLIEFPTTYQRSRLAPTQILYNWGAGFPGFSGVVAVGQCFRVRVQLDDQKWHSSRLKRIADDDDKCFTSVIAYSSDSGGFGFYGCGPADVVIPGQNEFGNCVPMVVEFVNVPNVTIPITAEMVTAYGELPSVQVWVYDTNGVLTNMGISANFIGGYPPTAIYVDLGGNASGVVRIG